jgi:hypothetical protein
VPPSGAEGATKAAKIVPFLGTNPVHQETGLLTRDEREVQKVQPSELPSELSSEGSRKRPDRNHQAWPVPEGGYISAAVIDIEDIVRKAKG